MLGCAPQLAAIINQPGENNPGKINLDETLVILNTEFGRSPGVQAPVGRAHYPNAYVTMMFGGPVGAAQRGIVGAIQPDGSALHPIGPAETRIATLAALGIYPFEPEGYAVSDVSGATTRAEAGMLVKSRVLGLT